MTKRAADPEAQTLLDWVAASSAPPIHMLSPLEARRAFRERLEKTNLPPVDVGHVEDSAIAGPVEPVPVRRYRPVEDDGQTPLLIYYHGGGFVIGDLETHDSVCRRLCRSARCEVVSVAYRLAPEHRFPAAVEDAMAALEAVASEAGARRRKIAVAGDSAGGTLAAVAAQFAPDLKLDLAAQVLIYPALDQGGDYPSRAANADMFPISAEAIRWFSTQYFGRQVPVDDPRASPIRAPSLSNLAPALVITAGLDPLCDEGAAYAERLSAAGGSVHYRCFEGTVHGFLGMGSILSSAQQAIEEVASFLRLQFANETDPHRVNAGVAPNPRT